MPLDPQQEQLVDFVNKYHQRTHAVSPDWNAVLKWILDCWEVLQASDIARSNVDEDFEPSTSGLLMIFLTECWIPRFGVPHQCPLLAAVSHSGDRAQLKKSLERLVGKLDLAVSARLPDPGTLLHNGLEFYGTKHSSILSLILLRARTIQVALEPDTPSPVPVLVEIIREYQRCWGIIDAKSATNIWSGLKSYAKDVPNVSNAGYRTGPSLLLRSKHREVSECLDRAVQQCQASYLDPAVACLADTLCQIHQLPLETGPVRSNEIDAWDIGTSYVVFAADGDFRTELKGALAILRVEEVRRPNLGQEDTDTLGAFYPDPNLAAFWTLQSSFQAGIRNAWKVASHYRRDPKVDYRWSVVFIDKERTTSLYRRLASIASLKGESCTLSFAACLRSCIERVPLDRHLIPTAAFEVTKSSMGLDDIDGLSKNPFLKTVTRVSAKDQGVDDGSEAIEEGDLDSVNEFAGQRKFLCAKSQPANQPIGRNVIGAESFDAAYKILSQDGQWTRAFNQTVCEKVRTYFEDYCFAKERKDSLFGAFQANDLKRRPHQEVLPSDEHRKPEETRDEPDEKWVLLKPSDAEYQALVAGKPRRLPSTSPQATPLTIVYADSGIGKSTWLMHAAYQIASFPDDRIVVLASTLREFLEQTDEEALWEHVYQNCVPGSIKNGSEERKTEIIDWLKQKRSQRKIVFLADALDQAGDKWDELRKILGLLGESVSLITMRPASKRVRPTGEKVWDEYELQGLSLEGVKTYLGDRYLEVCSAVCGEQLDIDREDEWDQEKLQVLTIPMVLFLIRKFLLDSRQSLDCKDLRNRYRLYLKVFLDGLICQGKKALEQERVMEVLRTFDLEDDSMTFRFFCHTAYWQARGFHHFDTSLPKSRNADYSQFLKRQFPGKEIEDIREAVNALNVLTYQSVFDGGKVREELHWRHRSFIEFLAGCRLAQLFHSEEAEERAEAMECIQRIASSTTKSGTPHPENLRTLWNWTLRFALGHAEELEPAHDHTDWSLAETLVAYGDPYVVYDAIVEDGLEVDPELQQLVRWLVHWTWDSKHYSYAYTLKTKDGEQEVPPTVTARLAALLVPMFERRYRNGPVLPAAWVLLEELGLEAWRTKTENHFFTDLVQDASMKKEVLDWLNPMSNDPGFLEIPPKDWKPDAESGFDRSYGSIAFDFGVSPGDGKADSDKPTNTRLRVKPFGMSAYTILNREFAWMDPSHRYRVAKNASHPLQPATQVSWYTAKLYGSWLSGNLKRLPPVETADLMSLEYGLPDEVHCEFAFRGGNKRRYWWNTEDRDEIDWLRCNGGESGIGHPLGKAFEVFGAKIGTSVGDRYRNPFGVVHALGDVWVWCEDLWKSEHPLAGQQEKLATMENVGNLSAMLVGSRSIRGGSFDTNESFLRVSCRYYRTPFLLYYHVGFRLMCIVR